MINYPYIFTINNKDDFELKNKIYFYTRISFMGIHKVEQIDNMLHIYLSIPESSAIQFKNEFFTRKLPILTNKIDKFVFYTTNKFNIKLVENRHKYKNTKYIFMIFDRPDTFTNNKNNVESILSSLDEYQHQNNKKRNRSPSSDRKRSRSRERESRNRRRSYSREPESRNRKRSRERESEDYESSRRYYRRSCSPEYKSRRPRSPERSDNKPLYEGYYGQQIPYGYHIPYVPYGNQVPYENHGFYTNNSSYVPNHSQPYGQQYPSMYLPHSFPPNL
jgi:hypothetical protein